MALIKSIYVLGILRKHRKYFWNLFFWSIFNKLQAFPLAITCSIYGYHFRKIFKDVN